MRYILEEMLKWKIMLCILEINSGKKPTVLFDFLDGHTISASFQINVLGIYTEVWNLKLFSQMERYFCI